MALNQKTKKQPLNIMQKAINPFTWKRNTERKIKYQPSIVVPDATLSLAQILGKHAGGQYRGLDPVFTDPEMMEFKQGIDARKMTLLELHEMRLDNQREISKIRTEIQQTELAAREAKAQKERESWKQQIIEQTLNAAKGLQPISTNTP
jgi:hypothetical protein